MFASCDLLGGLCSSLIGHSVPVTCSSVSPASVLFFKHAELTLPAPPSGRACVFAHRPLLAVRSPHLFLPVMSLLPAHRGISQALFVFSPFGFLPSAELELELSCPPVIGAGNL